MKLPAVLVNFSYDPEWLLRYPDIEPIVIYDRTEGPADHLLKYGAPVKKTPNLGDVDHDKLTWLIENYDNLPDVFLWSKTNLFKFISEDEFKKVRLNSAFTPLLTLSHRIYPDRFGAVNGYKGTEHGPIYCERQDVTDALFRVLDNRGHFNCWEDWARTFMLPVEQYIPFAPGGSYILTRETVHKHSRDIYEAMRDTLPYAQRPVEAHMCERSYFYLWR